MNSITTLTDLEIIAKGLRNDRSEDAVIKVKINATKEDILRMCPDQHIQDNIDRLASVNVEVNGVSFELLKSKKHQKIN